MYDIIFNMKILYKEHFYNMLSNNIFEFSEKDVEYYLKRLIDCLPNGKLYKYRNFKKKQFDYTYDALKEGYLWLSYADEFNDKQDTTINYDPLIELQEYQNRLLNNPREALSMMLPFFPEELRSTLNSIGDETLKLVSSCLDEDGDMNKQELLNVANKMGIIPTMEEIKRLDIAEREKNEFLKKLIPLLKDFFYEYVNVNKNIQKKCLAYCFADSHVNNGMWTYYSDSNKGYCIEYDLNKALCLSIEEKRKIINIFKVVYGEKERLSMLELIETQRKNGDLSFDIRQKYLEQLLTKEKTYQAESEWRLVLIGVDQKLYIDLVDAIFIDEDVVSTPRAKALINLAKDKQWKVFVRKLNYFKTKYVYEHIDK